MFKINDMSYVQKVGHKVGHAKPYTDQLHVLPTPDFAVLASYARPHATIAIQVGRGYTHAN